MAKRRGTMTIYIEQCHIEIGVGDADVNEGLAI